MDTRERSRGPRGRARLVPLKLPPPLGKAAGSLRGILAALAHVAILTSCGGTDAIEDASGVDSGDTLLTTVDTSDIATLPLAVGAFVTDCDWTTAVEDDELWQERLVTCTKLLERAIVTLVPQDTTSTLILSWQLETLEDYVAGLEQQEWAPFQDPRTVRDLTTFIGYLLVTIQREYYRGESEGAAVVARARRAAASLEDSRSVRDQEETLATFFSAAGSALVILAGA